MFGKITLPIRWVSLLSILLTAVFLFEQPFFLKAAPNKSGATEVYLPVGFKNVTVKGAIQTVTLTLPSSLAAATGSWCTWGGCEIGPRLYHVILSNDDTLLGWTDNTGSGHVSLIIGNNIHHTFDFPFHHVRGLFAHDDATFAVLLHHPASNSMWLTKRAINGDQLWNTNLNDGNSIPDFWLGDGRLDYGNGRYIAYYTVTGFGGHHGDTLVYINGDGQIQSGGWGWGCSHSMAELVGYHPDLDQFMAICSSDCYASKGILINASQPIYEADGNCGGNVSAQLGQLAVGDMDWKLVFNALDRPCCTGYGIGLATIVPNGSSWQSSYTWLTQSDGSNERDPVLARLGTVNGMEWYLVGWMTTHNNVYYLGVIDEDGHFIYGPEEVSSAGIRWGNRDDSLRQRSDGRVSWVQGNPQSNQLRLHIFDGNYFMNR